jgi:hypothetical protein
MMSEEGDRLEWRCGERGEWMGKAEVQGQHRGAPWPTLYQLLAEGIVPAQLLDNANDRPS